MLRHSRLTHLLFTKVNDEGLSASALPQSRIARLQRETRQGKLYMFYETVSPRLIPRELGQMMNERLCLQRG